MARTRATRRPNWPRARRRRRTSRRRPRRLRSNRRSRRPALRLPATKTLTPERLQELITATQQVQGLSDEVKAEVQKRYQAALEWLVSADETAQRTAKYESETQQAPQLVEKAKQELATNQSVGPADPPADATLPQLEQLLAEAQTRLNEAQQRLAQREDEVKRRGDRQGELAKLSEETKQRLEETQKQSGSLPPSGEAAELTAARRIELEARSLALKNQFALSKAESQRLDLLSELFPLNRDLAKREKNVCEKQVTILQEIVSQRREIESERQAQEARRQVQMAHPALRNLAERNAALAEMRQSVSEHITQVSAEVSQIEKSLESLQGDFQRAQDKVAKAGHSTTVGFMLRRQREQLPQVHDCEGRIRFVAREMPVANLDRSGTGGRAGAGRHGRRRGGRAAQPGLPRRSLRHRILGTDRARPADRQTRSDGQAGQRPGCLPGGPERTGGG